MEQEKNDGDGGSDDEEGEEEKRRGEEEEVFVFFVRLDIVNRPSVIIVPTVGRCVTDFADVSSLALVFIV